MSKRKNIDNNNKTQYNTLLKYGTINNNIKLTNNNNNNNNTIIQWTCNQCTLVNNTTINNKKQVKCTLCDNTQSINNINADNNNSDNTVESSVNNDINTKDNLIVLIDNDDDKTVHNAAILSNKLDTANNETDTVTINDRLIKKQRKSTDKVDVSTTDTTNNNNNNILFDDTNYKLSTPTQPIKPLSTDLLYYNNFITAAEHNYIVTELDKYQWQYADGKIHPRRMQLYGIFGENGQTGYYKGNNAINAFPSCLKFLVERLIKCNIYSVDDAPTTMIIQEYRITEHGAEGLGSHIDNPFFGNIVADISFLQPCVLRWNKTLMSESYNTVEQYVQYHKQAYKEYGGFHGRYITKDTEQVDITLEPQSLLVFKNDARWKWLHSVPKIKKQRQGGLNYRRFSITMRTLLHRKQHYNQLKFVDPPIQQDVIKQQNDTTAKQIDDTVDNVV